MNLLLTITAYPPSVGGAQIHTHRLAVSLAQKHSVQVISHWDSYRNDWLMGTTLRAPEDDYLYNLDGISVKRLGLTSQEKGSLKKYVYPYYFCMDWSIQGLSENLSHHLYPEAGKADLIHNVRIGREPLSFASLKTARDLGVPFVFTPLHHPRWSGWLHRHYHEIYRQADAVIALTEAEKETIVQLGVKPEKVHVTGIGPILAETANGVKFRETYQIPQDGPMVLFLGQKYEYKGVAQLLNAARIAWKQVPNCRFVFIGPETDFSRKLFLKVTDPRVIVLDTVDLQTKTDALDTCSLLCVPSSQESFGGVYTEAWSFHKPVIGCKIPAVSEVIKDGVNGILVEQDIHQISNAIIEILTQPGRSENMGMQGFEKVSSRYSWGHISGLTENIYLSLI
jgi:glycosyltransferase involved in cell wall biosynthesis